MTIACVSVWRVCMCMCVLGEKNLVTITEDVPRDWHAIDGRRLADSLFLLGKGPRTTWIYWYFVGLTGISLNRRETVNHSGLYASTLSKPSF